MSRQRECEICFRRGWRCCSRPSFGADLKDNEAGELEAVEEGAHDELVVVGDAVVGQFLLALPGYGGLQLIVAQVAHPGQEAAGCIPRLLV